MTITIGLGWWLAPAFITIALFVAVAWWSAAELQANDRFGIGALFSLIGYTFAALLSIIAWLIWWGWK
jgi:hypothetical protein